MRDADDERSVCSASLCFQCYSNYFNVILGAHLTNNSVTNMRGNLSLCIRNIDDRNMFL
ncbi:hypothetical protein CRE_02406 [Caenorhabditis remanei]|uniref:Uncharacterized protein n=1 Tax=Caenorhabditis remanei TaxID=31234 RepID=E3MIM8_CAERE|nr:hypothetical protein CRE_02406 [Caenorhabditis remanei]